MRCFANFFMGISRQNNVFSKPSDVLRCFAGDWISWSLLVFKSFASKSFGRTDTCEVSRKNWCKVFYSIFTSQKWWNECCNCLTIVCRTCCLLFAFEFQLLILKWTSGIWFWKKITRANITYTCQISLISYVVIFLYLNSVLSVIYYQICIVLEIAVHCFSVLIS